MENFKYEKLKKILIHAGSLVVAYSGGTDSTLVLKVAHDSLGDKVVAMTSVSASLPKADLLEAQQIARQIGVKHVLVDSEETSDPDYLANTPSRCFFCKKQTYGKLRDYAQQHGFLAIADGTNADDIGDFRPGRQAARDYNVSSPLLEAGFSKAEIRQLARELGLPNWNKPAAACLSSRIPYGTTITLAALSQVEDAEAMLHGLGLQQVRVRHHGLVARIEAEPRDFSLLLNRREEIVTKLKDIGYLFVTLDLSGFRSGSMNDAVKKHPLDELL